MQLTTNTKEEEEARLAILHELDVTSGPVDELFAFLVNTIVTALGVPMASLTLVDSEKQWLRPAVGFGDAVSSPRETGFCAWTIQNDVAFEVEDARADERFSDNPFVTDTPFIRSYAGVPLSVKGYRIGALCVMDTMQRRLANSERSFLISMAEVASRMLEERLTKVERDRALGLAVESEERLRFALDAAGIGDWDMNLQTNVARRSLMHDRCFGYEDAVAQWGYDTFLEHVLPEDRERVNGHFQQAMAELGPYDVKFRCLWADGSLHWLWSKGRFYADSQGKAYRVAGIQADVTKEALADEQRASLEFQLREAQKNEAIGRLAGGIAHDFNNILGVVLGNAKLALDDKATSDPVRVCLDEIEKAGSRGKDLVQQILAFSRRQPTNIVVVHPGQQLTEMARLLRPLLPANIEIVLDLQANTPGFDADRVQIDQVVMNLITNAAYAMESKAGEIRIEARGCVDTCLNEDPSDKNEQTCVVISVIDNGAGMDAETRQHIFDPFFTTKPSGEGTGLGLAVVYGIVARHGGKIVVDSTPGAGTRFDLYFPASRAAVESAGTGSTETAPPAGEPKGRVLYIDDDDALVFLVTRLLERSGHEVVAFSSSLEALDLLRSTDRAFDAVISDYNMPGDNGVEVLREVRSLRPMASLALMSGFITDAMRQDAAAVGITEIVFKPDSATELAASMSRLLIASKASG